jgi:hypothetical protein
LRGVEDCVCHCEHRDVAAANLPLGMKRSTMIAGEDGRTSTDKDTVERDDFRAPTSNRQPERSGRSHGRPASESLLARARSLGIRFG